eukprot:Gb_11494 [translate_table: standard]
MGCYSHGISVREHSIGIGPIIGLASEVMVGYPHMRTMVRARVPIEIRLVAPIWRHCGILSKVKVVATPGVSIGPITTHIHVLVVVEALFGWTGLGFGISCSLVILWWSTATCVIVWHAGCAITCVSFVNIGLGLVGLRIASWSLIAIYCLLLLLVVPGLISFPHWLLGSKILRMSVGSHLAFMSVKRILPYTHWFFSFALYFTGIRGRVTCDSFGGVLGFDPRSLFVNFLIELVLMSKTKGSPLGCPIGVGGCFFHHLVIGLRNTSRIPVFASLRPSVSKGCVLLYLVFKAVFYRPGPFPFANEQSFRSLILASWPTPVLWAASEDPWVAIGLVRNHH